MLSVKVSSKHQISLPSAVRKRLGIEPGDRLTVEVRGDLLVLTPRRKASERMMGIGRHIWDGVDPVERIRRERDEDEESRSAGGPR